MTADEAEDPHAELVRPFLNRKRPLPPMSPDSDSPNAGSGVRAYAMTGGRSQAAVQLEFETMLQATGDGREALTAVRFERAEILRLCHSEPQSVAELAARMKVPIGVVRVVAGDLLAEGYVQAFHPSVSVADDVLLITRLIAGVRSL
ncbi:MAG: DUF742 domain-containing protein [Actinobacteria bacterium]|nr:DUF742 domain-containing protein [Actinomycetota bacterium]